MALDTELAGKIHTPADLRWLIGYLCLRCLAHEEQDQAARLAALAAAEPAVAPALDDVAADRLHARIDRLERSLGDLQETVLMVHRDLQQLYFDQGTLRDDAEESKGRLYRAEAAAETMWRMEPIVAFLQEEILHLGQTIERGRDAGTDGTRGNHGADSGQPRDGEWL